MARSIDEIAAEMEPAVQAEVPQLTSNSQASRWRLIVRGVATAMHVLETMWDAAKAEIKAEAERSVPGTEPWLIATVKQFQYASGQNFVLQFDDNYQVVYDVVDPTARIITHVAVQRAVSPTGVPVVLVKVAKEGPTPLATDELTSFRGFLAKNAILGGNYQGVSYEPAQVSVGGTIYYDPAANLTEVQAAVAEAVQHYISNIDFNGELYHEKIEDAIQAVPNVTSLLLNNVQVTQGSSTQTLGRKLQLLAGYAELGTPLDQTLQWEPEF